MKREILEEIRKACVFAMYAQSHRPDIRAAMDVEAWKTEALRFYKGRGWDSCTAANNGFRCDVEALMYRVFELLQNEPPVINSLSAFLTGSRAYGTPTDKSDTDVVVLMDKQTAEAFLALADKQSETHTVYNDDCDTSLRFGKLNLIICYAYEVFEAWHRCTTELIKCRPVSRDEAKTVLQPLCRAAQAQAKQRITRENEEIKWKPLDKHKMPQSN